MRSLILLRMVLKRKINNLSDGYYRCVSSRKILMNDIKWMDRICSLNQNLIMLAGDVHFVVLNSRKENQHRRS